MTETFVQSQSVVEQWRPIRRWLKHIQQRHSYLWCPLLMLQSCSEAQATSFDYKKPIALSLLPGNDVSDGRFRKCGPRKLLLGAVSGETTYVFQDGTWRAVAPTYCRVSVKSEIPSSEAIFHEGAISYRLKIDPVADSITPRSYLLFQTKRDNKHIYIRQLTKRIVGGVCRRRSCDTEDYRVSDWSPPPYDLFLLGGVRFLHIRSSAYSSASYRDILIPTQFMLSTTSPARFCIRNVEVITSSTKLEVGEEFPSMCKMARISGGLGAEPV